jgi:2-methylcitrate dehydratase PrpD
MSHTSTILDFAAAPHVLPAAVRVDAIRLLADTLAVGAAGANSAEARSVLNTVRSYTEGPTDDCRILGSGLWLAPVSAAFLNGFQIHCLEWDAVHEPAVVHALSVVTAALLAVSDRAGGCDPEAFLTALAVGVDIASGLGVAATGPMRFFRPATAGVIGAALAVARLEGCTRDQMADVLGLAYSFAGGTMQAHVEASVALPLQIGRAAQAAVQAVDLVKAGLTGPHDVLEGPFGYSAIIEPLDLTGYVPGQPWRISEVSIKPFPCGRASHGALGALQDMRMVGEIAAITLHAPPLIQRLIGRPFIPGAPMSYNRLCLAFLAPLMLRDGIIDPRLETTDEFLAKRIDVVLNDNPDPNAMSPQRIVITLANGQEIERSIPANPGSPAQPMSPTQAAAKYALCRELAGDVGDPRLFDDPLSYATEPA